MLKKTAWYCQVLGCVLFISGFAFAQIEIPSVQGTWEFSISGKDTSWMGQAEGMKDKGKLFIYQSTYQANVPNLSTISENDPDDPFEGFIQGNQFSLHKNNQHGTPNLGREIIVGKLNKKGNVLSGKGMGFDSNTDWGSTWSYNFRAKKISDDVPAIPPEPPPPEPPPGQTIFMMDCDRCVTPEGVPCETDPFQSSHANYTLSTSGITGSIAAVGVEISDAGGTLAHLELMDETMTNTLAVSQDVGTWNVGWIEFIFSPAFLIDRTSLKLIFIADGSARAFNCSGTIQFDPLGLTAYGLGQAGHLVRSYINIKP